MADLGAVDAFGGLDFDGSRFAYGLRTCREEVDLFVRSIAAGPASAPAAQCPVTVASRRLRADRRGRVRVLVNSRRGSAGFIRLRAGRRGLASAGFKVAPGRRAVSVRLQRSEHRRLRARGLLRLRVVLDTRDRSGERRITRRDVTLRSA